MTSASIAIILLLAFLHTTVQCIEAAVGTSDIALQEVDTVNERHRTSRVERSAGNSKVPEMLDELEKRKWQKNTVRVWGKRDQDGFDAESKTPDIAGIVDSEEDVGTDKRHWSPRNKVRVWGKRSEEFGNSDRDNSLGTLGRPITGIEAGEAELDTEEKRKWADNRVKVWGKRRDSSTQPFAWKGINPTTGSPDRNEENSLDVDELIKQRASVVKRAIDDRLTADSARSSGGRYVWVPDVDAWPIDPVRSSPFQLLSDTEKRASSGYSGLTPSGGGRYWRANGAGPKRSWRTNVIRVWG